MAREWLFGLPGEFPIVQCETCTLVYLAERPTRDKLSEYYPETAYYSFREPTRHRLFARRDSLARLWYFVKKSVLAARYGYSHLGGSALLGKMMPPRGVLHRHATFDLEVLLHHFVPGSALLEVGCGAGRYLDLMRALGWQRVVGVDVSATAIRHAREALELEAYEGRVEEIALAPGTFAAASLSHTLEHVPDPVGTLRRVHDLLRPGGALAVIVPNSCSLGFARFRQEWVPLDAPRHLVHFSRESLRLTCTDAGFEVVKMATSAGGAYEVELFSASRRHGDPRHVYTDDAHRFPATRRIAALAFALEERVRVYAGQPAGEEILVTARKPL
jgi:SAM-dependent methyltransferase